MRLKRETLGAIYISGLMWLVSKYHLLGKEKRYLSISRIFFKKFSMELGLERKRLSDEAMEMLQNYSWPGNVRELQNVLKRAVIVGKGNYITKEDIYFEKEVKEKDLKSILTEIVESFLQTCTPDPYHTLLKKLEKLLIKKALIA